MATKIGGEILVNAENPSGRLRRGLAGAGQGVGGAAMQDASDHIINIRRQGAVLADGTNGAAAMLATQHEGIPQNNFLII